MSPLSLQFLHYTATILRGFNPWGLGVSNPLLIPHSIHNCFTRLPLTSDGSDKFGIKVGYFEKISLLNLNGRIGFGSPNDNIIGLKGVVDIGTGTMFLGIMADPTTNTYFAGLDVGVAAITGRAGITLGNFAEVGVYGEALGAGFKLGLIFKDGALEFKAGGTFIIGGGFYIRIKF